MRSTCTTCSSASAAIRSVLDRLSSRPRRIRAVLPIRRKLSLGASRRTGQDRELDQRIRWQVRKAAPFKIEDAQVLDAEDRAAEGGRESVVTVARRDIIESYERACEAAGAYPGIVDLATVNLVMPVLATDGRAAASAIGRSSTSRPTTAPRPWSVAPT